MGSRDLQTALDCGSTQASPRGNEHGQPIASTVSKHHVTARVNGNPVEFLCETHQSLLEVLRDELGLTGTKEGCSTGDCGACSVTIDGRLTCSCLVLGVEAEGKAVETIEGMATGSQLHPLQRKLLEHAPADANA